jgi:hypothetical protein
LISTQVMMANAGPQGRFNRAQRAVFNYDEALPLFLSGLLLNALLGPAALILAVLNASGRRAFARAYTDSLEGRGGGFVRAVAPEHVSAALNLVIAALIFAPRFDIDVPAPPKFLP